MHRELFKLCGTQQIYISFPDWLNLEFGKSQKKIETYLDIVAFYLITGMQR